MGREAWLRRVRVPELPEFVRECTASRVVRCAFVESTVGQVASIGTELREEFGFEVAPVHADRFAPIVAEGEDLRPRLPAELREADFIATTAFYAREMEVASAALDVPLVVIRLNAMFVREVQRRLAEEELVVVCTDPLFAERLKLFVGDQHPERVRTVLASDRDVVARLDPSRPVLVSEAARQQLPDLWWARRRDARRPCPGVPRRDGPMRFRARFPAPGRYKLWLQLRRADRLVIAPIVVDVREGGR